MNQHLQNRFIAGCLREAASLLQQQGANRFRVDSYRRAAETVESLPDDIGLLLQVEGTEGLQTLTGIGPYMASAIAEMVRTHHWNQLERLRGAQDPATLFGKVPGIGLVLARNIVDELHIDRLEALEVAAHNGRLRKVGGFGPRRLAMVRSGLAEMLGRPRGHVRTGVDEPSVSALLDADREYREKAATGALRRIAPKRFNPENVVWLPVLRTEREGWQLTMFYSNTALAHQSGRTRDWVVVSFHRDSEMEEQRTIVSETHGRLRGKRVVRGRENETERYYNPVLFESSAAA